MNLIIKHIDELLDYFPVNKITKKMRMDLLETTSIDYEKLIESGVNQQEASQTIISQIATPDLFAKMIPNKHTLSYYLYWLIAIFTTIVVFRYVSQPNFLQIFLPARMEFPDIIEKYIHYFFVLLLSYAGIYLFYRYLPQKWLNRNEIQTATFLYIGTIMAALYFSIAIAFVWYTLNGYLPVHITFDLVSSFIYSFYQVFFQSEIIVIVYAIINALMFVLSRQAYHLDNQPEPYVFENIYQTNEAISALPEAMHSIEEIPNDTISLKDVFNTIKAKLFKKKIKEEEKKEPTFAALEVTEEVISFLIETSNQL